jgi:ribosomal protein RSM22 (predicted rRNA methylase)
MRPIDAQFAAWFDALYARHTASLEFSEIRRALQALTRLYVQKRTRLAAGSVFEGAGKRAAFALFYTPLHFLMVRHILESLAAPTPTRIVDLGCGTGAGAAAWASLLPTPPRVEGSDLNAWAISEARWNWQWWGLRGSPVRADAVRRGLDGLGAGDAVVAAYLVNELPQAGREALLGSLLRAAARGTRVLVIEPIAKSIVPWWPAWVAACEAHGGRVDTWRTHAAFPEKLALLDRAAGLDHREMKARTLMF